MATSDTGGEGGEGRVNVPFVAFQWADPGRAGDSRTEEAR